MRVASGADVFRPPSPVGHAASDAKEDPEKYLLIVHHAVVYSMRRACFTALSPRHAHNLADQPAKASIDRLDFE